MFNKSYAILTKFYTQIFSNLFRKYAFSVVVDKIRKNITLSSLYTRWFFLFDLKYFEIEVL